MSRPIPTRDDLSATARYADFLKQTYRALPTLQKYKCLPTPSRKAIRLISVTEVKGRKTVNPIAMEDILKPASDEERGCIVIEGECGVGKSALATEMCQRWNDIEILKQYSLVILVRLQERKMQEAKHIVDIFYHPSVPVQQAVAREVVERDGQGTLLIFDGVDQLPQSSRQSHPLAQILEGSVLQKAKVLIVSCTSCSSTDGAEEFLSDCEVEVSRHIKVLGFGREEIRQHVESSFSSVSSQAESCSSYLSCNPVLRDAMNVPFNCAIVVEAYKQATRFDKPPPRTMSQVYHITLQQILRHNMLVRGIGSQSQILTFSGCEKLEDLPAKVYQQLCSLAQFAFTALLKRETVFHKLPRNCNHFGFMHTTPEIYIQKKDASIVYSFLHVGLQRYLAAFHVSRLPLSEQKEIFRQHVGSPCLNQVWRFLAGITGSRAGFWELAKAELRTDGTLSSQLLQCLHEAHEKTLCESALESRALVFSQAHYSEEILPGDMFSLGWCLGNSSCTLSLRLRLDSEQLRMLSLGLRASDCSPTGSSTIDTLYLRPPVPQEAMETLSSLPSHVAIHGLDLSHCEATAAVLNALGAAIPQLTSLRHLDVRGNLVGEGGLVQFLHALSKSRTLQSLSMINAGLGPKDIVALSRLISPQQTLKELRIGDEGMSDDITNLLVSTVFKTSSLRSLHLWFTDFKSSVDTLAGLLKANSNVSELECHACKFGSHGSKQLARTLESNTAISSLVLSMYDVPSPDQIGSEGAVALADMLRTNTKLERLELLFDKSLERQGALALVESLKHNRTLKHLKIPQQHFKAGEISAMDPRISWSGP